MPIPSSGSEPTGIVATTRFVRGSMRSTLWLSLFDSHTDPKPIPSHPGPAGTCTRSTMGNAARGDCPLFSAAAVVSDACTELAFHASTIR